MNVSASPNRATEAGGDFVIAQIDMCAATGTIRRSRLIADFMFAFTLETGDETIALTSPNIFQFTMNRGFTG